MFVGSLVMSLWVIYPLIYYKNWVSINEFFTGSPLERGYGARVELGWLFTGRMFDYNRPPVFTLFVLVGIIVSIVVIKRFIAGRLLLILFAAYLIVSFGPTSLHAVADIIPGHSDLFFRRFIIGTDLMAILIAGIGLDYLLFKFGSILQYIKSKITNNSVQVAILTYVYAILLLVMSVLLAPMFTQLYRYDASNATQIQVQNIGQITQSQFILPLISYIKNHQTGRTYAGLPTNWGQNFVVGEVPVFKYLESEDIQEVGYTLRTASLMTDPEAYFNENNPSDYILFGIRYLILPKYFKPFIPCNHIMTAGNYSLWETPYGFVHLVTTVSNISLNRHDVGMNSVGLLNSNMLIHNKDMGVNWNNISGPKPLDTPSTNLGTILSVHPDLINGYLTASVIANHKAILLLSASYDPGWTVTVDNRPAKVIMLAPAVVGVEVQPGRHEVSFKYVGFQSYTLFFVLAFLAFMALVISGKFFNKVNESIS